MEKEHWLYKGRAVLRGDDIRDEEGDRAYFTEQGASATMLAGTKLVDVIAHFPGCKGEIRDASGAYTQIKMKDAAILLGMEDYPTTWIVLPRSQWSPGWEKIRDPVVPLLVNLYGHPIAGLLWEKGRDDIIIDLGFERVPGWE